VIAGETDEDRTLIGLTDAVHNLRVQGIFRREGDGHHLFVTEVLGRVQDEPPDQNKTPQALSSHGTLVEQSFPRKLLMISLAVCDME
jgi:hypothetical protein